MMKNLRKSVLILGTALIMTITAVPAYAEINEEFVEYNGFTEAEKKEFETGQNTDMILVDTQIQDIDDEIYVEVNDYEENLTKARAITRKVNRSRVYNVKSKKTSKILLTFNMYAKFQYNGQTSKCLDSYVKVSNPYMYYSILNDSSVESGNTAIFYCYAKNKKTSKQFGGTFKITVSKNGVATNS